ncbi:hypothetical protein DSUL_90063 [Desulfovibrionales bacterium]
MLRHVHSTFVTLADTSTMSTQALIFLAYRLDIVGIFLGLSSYRK